MRDIETPNNAGLLEEFASNVRLVLLNRV
jgi:hypothetical protein